MSPTTAAPSVGAVSLKSDGGRVFQVARAVEESEQLDSIRSAWLGFSSFLFEDDATSLADFWPGWTRFTARAPLNVHPRGWQASARSHYRISAGTFGLGSGWAIQELSQSCPKARALESWPCH